MAHKVTIVRLGAGEEDAGRSLFYQLSDQQCAFEELPTWISRWTRRHFTRTRESDVSSHNGAGRVGWIIRTGVGDSF